MSVATAHPFSDEIVELIAERFRALGDPTRVKLLERLRDHEATVRQLTAAVGTTEQNVSKHLGVLRRVGLVARRRHGNFSFYSLADEQVLALCEIVCGSLQHRVEDLSGLVAAGVR